MTQICFFRVKAVEPHSCTRLERNDTGSSGTDDVESGAGFTAGTAQRVYSGNHRNSSLGAGTVESSRKPEAPARKFSDMVRGKSPVTEKRVTHTQHSIPVRITCDASATGRSGHNLDSSNFNRQDDDAIIDDVEFSEFVQKRTKRFFVCSFKSSITEDKLIKYVERRGLTVTWVNIWTSAKSGRVTIRLNIEVCKDYRRISKPGFWPKGVTCRPWVTKNAYNNRNNTYSYNDGRDYHAEHGNYNADRWQQYENGKVYNETY